MFEEERLAANTMQAIKASKKISRSQPHTGGSSERAGITQRFLMSLQASLQPQVKELGSENESDYSEEDKVNEEEIKWLSTDKEVKKQDDDDDDRSIDLEETDDEDEYAEYKARDDEYVHKDKHVHDSVDEEMKDTEDDETGKDDTAKADVDKTEEVKGADKQARIKVANVDQAKDTSAQDNHATALVSKTSKEMPKLPPTSSSLSVSSGFGNQFLNLSSDISLIGTVKDSADVEINSLLDIQIQQEVPQIQSPTLLNVPVSVNLEQPVPTPSPALTTKTLVSTVLSHSPSITTITPVQQQTTPIPTPPITSTTQPVTSLLPAIETSDVPVPSSEALTVVLQRVSTLDKDVKELKQVDHFAVLHGVAAQYRFHTYDPLIVKVI
ncbi:hypothetical protein Tco_0522805 [Tanacetum coccineum]